MTHVSSMRFVVVCNVIVVVVHFAHKLEEFLRLDFTANKQVMLIH